MRLARLVLLLVAVACTVAEPQAAAEPSAGGDSTLIISFLDVGQGDATMIQTSSGKRVLIDAGPSRRALERHLRRGGDTLDLVIASHNHEDHIGGMLWVLRRFAVRAWMDNGVPHTTMTYRSTMRAVEAEQGLTYLEATDRTITLDSLRLHVLPPHRVSASQNDNSVGVLVQFGQFRALITGDSERPQITRWIREGRVGPVQLLKAPHHGAVNGYSAEFAERTRPGAVVVSVARRNGYGHPVPSVLDAWTRAGASIYRTDSLGTIIVVARLDGSFRVKPAAPSLQP